jgi:hypothetical protein
MDKKRKEKFEITELFGAQPNKDRLFTGCIKRLKDNSGKPFVFSRIVMPDGLLCASAPEQQELSDNLDKMCKMILDEGLHSDSGISTEIFGNKYFLN